MMKNKEENLVQTLIPMVKNGLCIAFSGGVDSAVLLKLASECAEQYGGEVQAVTFVTQLHPPADEKEAKKMAEEFGVSLAIIRIDEFSNPVIMKNPVDRCYHCKKMLFEKLKEFATQNNLQAVADGTNLDDLSEYRPGIKALKELSICSPLAECELTKNEIRQLAADRELEVSGKPSSPCLATRLPYHTLITKQVLKQIADSENLLAQLDFKINRVRVHGKIVRIEIPQNRFSDFFNCFNEVTSKIKGFGFDYVTLDLEGFRSGSMDEPVLKR